MLPPQYAFASASSSTVVIILNLFLSICFILIHAFSCLQTTPLCSVWEGFFLLIMSYKIISLDPIHPSLRLPISAPSLSINFFYFFLQLYYVPVTSLQPKLPFLRSALWWTCCPTLTVIHGVSRQPVVASSLDCLSSIPMTVHRILSWKGSEGKRKEDSFLNGPSTDGANFVADNTLRCHLLDTVTPANKLIKRVTVTQWHTYTDVQRQESIHTRRPKQTPGRSEWQRHTLYERGRHSWVTEMTVSPTKQLKATMIACKKWVRLLCCQGGWRI